MIKEILYSGHTNRPSDYEAPDGTLAACFNLINEDNHLTPIFQPGTLYNLPAGHTVRFVHTTATGKHYIVHNTATGGLGWFRAMEDDELPATLAVADITPLQGITAATVHDIEAVGNTLIVMTPAGLQYFLWKQNSYAYLGNQLPELNLRFRLSSGSRLTSDQHIVDIGGPYVDVQQMWRNEEVKAALEMAADAAAKQVQAMANEKKWFHATFFVRYAYRLFDGTLTRHSAPILMMNHDSVPEIDLGFTMEGTQVKADPAKVTASLSCHSLYYSALSQAEIDNLMQFKDIITGVDIFISRLFSEYDQGQPPHYSHPATKDITTDITGNGNFYHLCSIALDEIYIGDGTQPVPASQARPRPDLTTRGQIKPDFNLSNDLIVTREVMDDDYDSHDTLRATIGYTFNNRLNLAGLKKRPFAGFSPATLFFEPNVVDSYNLSYRVIIDIEGQNIVTQSPAASVNMDDKGTLWFYYPSTKATHVVFNLGPRRRMVTLKKHNTLNGTYFYGNLALDEIWDNDPQPDVSTGENVWYPLLSKIYTSDVGNPFVFPLGGINTVGSGTIISLCSAVTALSQGQFGQFPLYAFTTDGVWALETNATGTYSAKQPVTRDVVLTRDSILQLDNAVLFATARGLMLLQGSSTACISDDINAADPFNLLTMPYMQHVAGFAQYDATRPLPMPLGQLLDGCQMIYDYTGQHIIVFNPSAPYALVYSLRSRQWGMTRSDLAGTINAYPDALAMTGDNRLVSFSRKEDDVSHGFFVTRPIKLDAPDALKTVDTVIQRGQFQRGDVATILYASRDLYHWFMVRSSVDHYLRGYSGTPFKYFRIAGITTLCDGKSISGATVQYTPRHTNQPR